MNFENINKFYSLYKKELLEEDRLRPCKSVPRDTSAPIDKFIEYYKNTKKTELGSSDILGFLGLSNENDTYNTNIRDLKEFKLLSEKDDRFVFTDKFMSLIEKEKNGDTIILGELYKISGLQTINMVLNTILCALREGYIYNEIIVYPESFEAFKNSVPNKKERLEFCERVYEIYGFHGRGRDIADDNYTPNANYRVITELVRLNLIVLSNNNTDLKYYKLTPNAYHLLETIDKNLLNISKDENKNEYNFLSGEGKNLVIYGTPGCGKSYILDKILKNLGDININELKYKGLGLTEDRIIRTTFHHDYSNTDFIGQIVPQVDSDGSATYVINPGPFTKALTKAFQSNESVALVIEELNRGDAAGILGDIFQLLDRYKEDNDSGIKGASQYPIENRLIQTYLTEQTDYKFDNIRIPSNLYIFATMNTSDQNVFTLDTAFKRRWDFIKMRNDYSGFDKNLYVPGSDMVWAEFVEKLNKKMLRINGQINEDKQLGLYFVEKELLVKENEEFNEERIKKFAFKVLEYLWDDVVRYDRQELFDNKIETLDDLIDKYVSYAKNNESLKVFNNDFFS